MHFIVRTTQRNKRDQAFQVHAGAISECCQQGMAGTFLDLDNGLCQEPRKRSGLFVPVILYRDSVLKKQPEHLFLFFSSSSPRFLPLSTPAGSVQPSVWFNHGTYRICCRALKWLQNWKIITESFIISKELEQWTNVRGILNNQEKSVWSQGEDKRAYSEWDLSETETEPEKAPEHAREALPMCPAGCLSGSV